MSLIEQIRQDQLTSRKNRNVPKTALLTTLLGEVGMVAKNAGRADATDDEVIAMIKKFVKNAQESIQVTLVQASAQMNVEKLSELRYELVILNGYLPKQLSREELAALRVEKNPANKGDWMKFLKENYAGLYDGKLASEVF